MLVSKFSTQISLSVVRVPLEKIYYYAVMLLANTYFHRWYLLVEEDELKFFEPYFQLQLIIIIILTRCTEYRFGQTARLLIFPRLLQIDFGGNPDFKKLIDVSSCVTSVFVTDSVNMSLS